MKNKGFTLVEVIGILVIIAIISLITIPLVGNTITKSKGQVNDTQIKLLEIATGNYITDNLQEATVAAIEYNESPICVAKLSHEGYIQLDIENKYRGAVIVTKTEKGFSYKYDDSYDCRSWYND